MVAEPYLQRFADEVVRHVAALIVAGQLQLSPAMPPPSTGWADPSGRPVAAQHERAPQRPPATAADVCLSSDERE